MPSIATLLAALLLAPSVVAQQQPPTRITGTIHTWGSPQMADLLHLFEQSFTQLHPGVRFDDSLQSTITAVAGVYTGRAEIGLLGREIWPTEVQAFSSVTGHPPLVLDIATGSYDVPKATFALMVFVPRANPVASLSTTQLARLFSNSMPHIRTWGELGLTGAWASHPIHLYGFNVDNDKSQIFRQLIFSPTQRWSAELHEFDNTPSLDAGQAIVNAIAADPDAIGISNVHYVSAALSEQLRALPLSTLAHPEPIPPTPATVASRLYPLTRAVYLVADRAALTPASREFIRFVLSPEGQKAVAREGNYIPLPAATASAQLASIP